MKGVSEFYTDFCRLPYLVIDLFMPDEDEHMFSRYTWLFAHALDKYFFNELALHLTI